VPPLLAVFVCRSGHARNLDRADRLLEQNLFMLDNLSRPDAALGMLEGHLENWRLSGGRRPYSRVQAQHHVTSASCANLRMLRGRSTPCFQGHQSRESAAGKTKKSPESRRMYHICLRKKQDQSNLVWWFFACLSLRWCGTYLRAPVSSTPQMDKTNQKKNQKFFSVAFFLLIDISQPLSWGRGYPPPSNPLPQEGLRPSHALDES